MKKLFYILLFFLVAKNSFAEIVPYFSPINSGCEKPVLENFENAKENIDVAMYAITNKKITQAIKDAYDRGIKIRILTDKKQAEFKLSTVRELRDYGIDIKVNSAHRSQHNKYSIYDNSVLITGSFNWTYSAGYKNSENCLVITEEPKLLQRYLKDFNYLWKINSSEKSDEWFLRLF